MNIEVGMMVEIISSKDMTSGHGLIGHRGAVIKPAVIYRDSWFIEGAEIDPADGKRMSFHENNLKPIPDQQEKESFVEKYSKSWSQPIEVEA